MMFLGRGKGTSGSMIVQLLKVVGVSESAWVILVRIVDNRVRISGSLLYQRVAVAVSSMIVLT